MAAKSGFNLNVFHWVAISAFLPVGYSYPPVLQTQISSKGNLVTCLHVRTCCSAGPCRVD